MKLKNVNWVLIFLIFALLTSAPVYAEVKGKEIKVSEGTVVITIHYQHGDDIWANNKLNSVAEIIKLIEEISRIPYPIPQSNNPYATENETKARIIICEFTDEIKECENGFGMTKTQDMTTTIRQIAGLWNTNRFRRDWLSQGHTSLYTYLVLKEMNQTQEAEKFKASLFFTYNILNYNIPLDVWRSQESVADEKQTNKQNYGIAKSFVFMHLIYKKQGNRAISETRRILNQKKIMADSREYKQILEGVTDENLDDLFSGWVFLGEYKVQHEELKGLEIASQKYNKVVEIYNKNPSEGLHMKLSNLHTKLYENVDINEVIESADEVIEEYKEIDIALLKYNEVGMICNKSKNKEFGKDLCDGLTNLSTELHGKGNVKKSIEYADELITRYEELKDTTMAGYYVEKNLTDISIDRYNKADNLYKEKGIFSKIGLIFYGSESDLDKAKTELDNGNFAAVKEYSDKAISGIEKAEKFGMVVAAVILLIFIIFLTNWFVKR